MCEPVSMPLCAASRATVSSQRPLAQAVAGAYLTAIEAGDEAIGIGAQRQRPDFDLVRPETHLIQHLKAKLRVQSLTQTSTAACRSA